MLTVSITADCGHGTASVDSNNVITYTPDPDYNGELTALDIRLRMSRTTQPAQR